MTDRRTALLLMTTTELLTEVVLALEGKRKPKSGSNPKMTDGEKDQAGRVLIYLNRQAGTKYSGNTNIELIVRRIREGATGEDFARVINNATAKWRDNSDMARYLRPSTLFGPKNFWEKYQGEVIADDD